MFRPWSSACSADNSMSVGSTAEYTSAQAYVSTRIISLTALRASFLRNSRCIRATCAVVRDQTGSIAMAQDYMPSAQDPAASNDDGGRLGALKAKAQDVGARAAQRADQARVGAASGLDS